MSSARDDALRSEVLDLRERLREAEETIEAIRQGDVDGVVVGGSGGPVIYTLESDDRPYRRLIEQIGEGALTLGPDGVVLYCNRALAGLLRVAQESIVGAPLQRFLPPPDAARLERLLERGEGRGEFSLRAGAQGDAGRHVPVVLSLSELGGGGARALCAVVTDLSRQMRASAALHEANHRLRAEIAERENTEAQLRQAQKMEAVGQLTGGLAHDFNNLLTGIIGSLELIQNRIAQGRTAELVRLADAAMASANRGAALTHRLLAFSRQQTLEPEATDANRLVAGLEELIRRTAGSAIVVTCAPAAGLWATLCDPNQLENAILNLCINARDAMPGGGRLRIETANARLDGAGRHAAPEPAPEPAAALPASREPALPESAAHQSGASKSVSPESAASEFASPESAASQPDAPQPNASQPHAPQPDAPQSATRGPVAPGAADGVPGDYVMVAVADTGTGMSPEVMARAFDPFFTTKPVGQGTGLGLSMIYGFARQSAGHVRLDSAPGQGTTVRLYLPRHSGPPAVPGEPAQGSHPRT